VTTTPDHELPQERQLRIQLGREGHGGALADRVRYFRSLSADDIDGLLARYRSYESASEHERVEMRAEWWEWTVEDVRSWDEARKISAKNSQLDEGASDTPAGIQDVGSPMNAHANIQPHAGMNDTIGVDAEGIPDDSADWTDNRHCEICGALLRWNSEHYYDFNGRRRTVTSLRCPTHGTRPDSAKRIRSIGAETAGATRSHNRWNPRPYYGSNESARFNDSYSHRVGIAMLFIAPAVGFFAGLALTSLDVVENTLLRLAIGSVAAFVAWLGAVGLLTALERPFERKWDESERRRVEHNEREREKRRERGQRSYSGLTKSKWKDLQREFDHRCAYCSTPLAGQAQRDHFLPFSKGIADDISNIVPACIECNRAKRDQMPNVWLAQCQREKKSVNPKLKEWLQGKTATD